MSSDAPDTAKSTTKDDASNGDTGPSEGDLVIRDGFPALQIPGAKTYQPMLKGEEPIPRHSFWSSENAVHFNPDYLESLRQDCETVFTARDKPDGAAYSAGQTFFLPANRAPRCALEALAMLIFRKHTEHLKEGTFNPAQSGANWWTLVLDENEEAVTKAPIQVQNNADEEEDEEEEGEDEVGLHFDADYELEEQTTHILLHPRVGTVTYLSDYGAPTVIFNLKSPPMDDLEKKSLEKRIDKAWLSHPQLGKHTCFDGRFLHGAPALYFPSRNNPKSASTSDEPDAKRQKVDRKRYTLLVNVWLNHWVMDAGLLDDEICAQLKTPWEVETSNLKGDNDYTPPFSWNNDVDLAKQAVIPSKVKLAPSKVNPAGEDEIALCSRSVTVKYNPLMEECRSASNLGSTVELELEEGAICLHVGEVLPTDEEEEAQ
jgi:hypothetical protein